MTNPFSSIASRPGPHLARWLLMCHDRIESDSFTLTQEFLGHMLGTPRTAVTIAAGALRKAGLIDYVPRHPCSIRAKFAFWVAQLELSRAS